MSEHQAIDGARNAAPLRSGQSFANQQAGGEGRLETLLLGRIRRRAIELLRLRAGANVLEVGCASGANFAPILSAIGPRRTLTGLDRSPSPLETARVTAHAHGWENVTLMCGELDELDIPGPLDGVLVSFAPSTITDHRLERLLDQMRPGGRLVIAGTSTPAWAMSINGILRRRQRSKGPWPASFDASWDVLGSCVDDVQVDTIYLGAAFLVAGSMALAPVWAARC